jgi:hypothetical protein
MIPNVDLIYDIQIFVISAEIYLDVAVAGLGLVQGKLFPSGFWHSYFQRIQSDQIPNSIH